MTREQAEIKAVETSKMNGGRPFKAVPVTYMNGEEGWDVTPVMTYYRIRVEVKFTSGSSVTGWWKTPDAAGEWLTFRAEEAATWSARDEAEAFMREHLAGYFAAVEELGVQ